MSTCALAARCPKQNNARGCRTAAECGLSRASAAIRLAVWSLLDTSRQLIEGPMQFETEFFATEDRSTVFVIESEQVVRSALHYILRDRHRTHAFAALDDALASAADVPDVVLLGASILRSRGEALLAGLGAQFAGAKILIVADQHSDPL